MAFHEQTGHKVAIKILNKKKIRQFGVFEKVNGELFDLIARREKLSEDDARKIFQ